MSEAKASRPRTTRYIRDARGRKVVQLDPVAMHLLRQHDVIEAPVLRAIAHQQGVRMAGKERVALIVGVVGLLTVAGLVVHSLIVGDFGGAPLARSASLLWFCFPPWLAWNLLKRSRFAKIAAAMLRYLRCPHCGYDLRRLPTDPADGATVCPECGCAWKLPGDAPASGAVTREDPS